MKTTKLQQLSLKIRHRKAHALVEQKQKEKAEREAKLKEILKEFEIGFAEQLPLLSEANITYSAHFNTKYENDGTYIEFTRGDKSLKMDFSKRNLYRYEYTGKNRNDFRMTYGNWPKDDFILFIDKRLFS